GELGETVGLARAFREAHTERRRRRTMQIATITVAGLALGLSTLGLLPSGTGGGATTPPAQHAAAAAADPEAEPAPTVVTISVEDNEVRLEEYLDRVAASIGRRALVRWAEMGERALDRRDDFINAASHDRVPLDEVLLRAFAEIEAVRVPGLAVDVVWRVRDDVVEIGAQAGFDLREMRRKTYDIQKARPVVRTGQVKLAEVGDIVRNSVEPNAWTKSGGKAANLQVVGNMMVVNAPPRIHREVTDLLRELEHERNIALVSLRKARVEERREFRIQEVDRLRGRIESGERRLQMLENELEDYRRDWAKTKHDQTSRDRENVSSLVLSGRIADLEGYIAVLREEIMKERLEILGRRAQLATARSRVEAAAEEEPGR
ncbi:MAG: hypothetical protein AAFU70_05805, partial [Planctomycetota bacterium]